MKINKPLLAAGVFTVCALGFLGYSWLGYAATKAAADDGADAWQQTETLRSTLDRLKLELAVVEPPPPPKNIDINAVMSELLPNLAIDLSQFKSTSRGSSAKEQAHYLIALNSINVTVMGKLLEQLRTRYGYLQVQSIKMRSILQKPGEFNWELDVSVPAAAK